MISANGITFRVGKKALFEDVNIQFTEGNCYGLIGANGTGKSTFLKILSGQLEPTNGNIAITPGQRLSFLEQNHFKYDEFTVLDTVIMGNQRLYDIMQEKDALYAKEDFTDEDGIKAAELENEFANMNGWDAESDAANLLNGLGVETDYHYSPMKDLPGALKVKVLLARALFGNPDILLLDEPTNHLDTDGREHLAHTIDDWQGPVLMTSHDRAFIERTATALLDLDPTPWRAVAISQGEPADFGAYRVGGSYSDYLRDKAAARSRHTAIHADQQAEKRRLVSHQRDSTVVGHARFKPRTEIRMAQKYYADRAQTVSTRRINDDSQRLSVLAAHEVPKPRYDEVAFSFPRAMRTTTGGTSPHPHAMGIALAVRGASVEGRLAPTSFEVRYGEHLLVAGPNGSGKTTLLEWIARGAPSGAHGCIDATSGVVLVPQVLPRPGDPLIPEDAWYLGIGEAGKGFVPPAAWNRPLGELSAGNQRRAQLAFAARADAQILVIDEPTNYLDLNALESLEETMRNWEGTLVISTHDEWLITRWWGRLHQLDERR